MTTPVALVTICCYCPGWQRDAPENKGASHGMCDACFARLMAELDAKEVPA